MRISAIAPVKNESPWIGYSIKAASPFIDEFIYAVSPGDDGTMELLESMVGDYNITIINEPNFDPLDTKAYNKAFNDCISMTKGDAVIFLHPDMIITEGAVLSEGPLAWWTEITSYAGDIHTQITKGRASRWKNIHAKKFGLKYLGGYGSQNEDFYHTDITGNALKHYGEEFSKYPFEVKGSGIKINHYCEVKSYSRRLEKMKLCLKTLYPHKDAPAIEEMAMQHPRVTLEPSSTAFGVFEFEKSKNLVPEVLKEYA